VKNAEQALAKTAQFCETDRIDVCDTPEHN